MITILNKNTDGSIGLNGQLLVDKAEYIKMATPILDENFGTGNWVVLSDSELPAELQNKGELKPFNVEALKGYKIENNKLVKK